MSIQVSLDGFSFCIANPITQRVEFLKKYPFEQKCERGELCASAQIILDSEPLLQQPFNQLVLIHKNSLSTLVPHSIFSPAHSADYLKYNARVGDEKILYEHLSQDDIVNVYIPFEELSIFFADKYANVTNKHHATLLIDGVLKLEGKSDQPKVYVNVSKSSFEMVLVEKGRLMFYNTFSYQTKEDFIYFLLNSVYQLSLNPEKTQLFFLGDIDTKDERFVLTYKYVRFVFLGQRSDRYHFSDQGEPSSNHSDFVTLAGL